jgi:hypothetical protein
MNSDLQALGAFLLVLSLGMLWLHVRGERNRKYSAAEWLDRLRELGLGTK